MVNNGAILSVLFIMALVLSNHVRAEVLAAGASDARPYESVTESKRLFDPDALRTVRGVVTDIDTVKMEHGTPFMELTLKANNDLVRVHVAPQWFMQEQIQRVELDVGREVEVKGSPQIIEGKPVLIAAEITNDRRDQRLRLRHQDGTPVWAGSEQAR